MALFGEDENEEISDAALIAAIRRRLMDEISGGRADDSERIVNNVYGATPMHGGLVDRLYQDQFQGNQPERSEDPYDYMVDISRRDVFDPEDPTRRIGWDKDVRRYREKKKA